MIGGGARYEAVGQRWANGESPEKTRNEAGIQ